MKVSDQNDTIEQFTKLARLLVSEGARSALKVLSPKLVVQATRICYGGKFPPYKLLDIRITAGRPNYLARRFIKACVKAGEPFPVKKIQFRYPKS